MAQYDEYGTEEEHIAATIIQCMVRRDQAIMFVDVLWEQTAAASSLQAMARGFLARKMFLKMLYAKGHHATFNKYRQRAYLNQGRPDSRASQLSSTNWASEDFDESEWEERYYQSSPEPYMQQKKNGVLNKQNLAHLNETKQIQVERSSKLSDETRGDGSKKSLPMYSATTLQEEQEENPVSPTIAKLNSAQMVKRAKERMTARTPDDVPDSSSTPDIHQEPMSPLRQQLEGSGVAQRAAASLRTASQDKVSSRPPSRQNDTEEVVAQGALLRAAESFGSSLQRARQRLSENDAHTVAVKGAAANKAAKYEQDAAWAVATKWREIASEHARSKPFKFGLTDNSVTPMMGYGSANQPGMLNVRNNGSFNAITGGAAVGESMKDDSLSLFGYGSANAPGMLQMRTGGNDITLGAASGKSVHNGGTFATSGSLNAPGMGKGKYISPEMAGSFAGASLHQGGTLLTNGSANTPGMASMRMKKYGEDNQEEEDEESGDEYDDENDDGSTTRRKSKFTGKSCDTGISLFGMGSMLSQAKAEEARQKRQNEIDKANSKSANSVDLPLWSLGSSISVAALDEQRSRQISSSSNTFGATAGGYGHKNSIPSTDVPRWSMGSYMLGEQGTKATSTNSFGKTNLSMGEIRTNTNGASHEAVGSATLMSFGSSGTPGMQRETATSSNFLGASSGRAVACSSEPSLIMMGSAKTPGMQSISENKVRSNTSGATSATQSHGEGYEHQGGESRYQGKKWTVGHHGAASLAASKSSFTHTVPRTPTDKPGGGNGNDDDSTDSVQHSVWSVDKHKLGTRNAKAVEGASGNTFGAEVTGKPIYTGPTFSTGGSAMLDKKPNKVVVGAGEAKVSVHRPPEEILAARERRSQNRSESLTRNITLPHHETELEMIRHRSEKRASSPAKGNNTTIMSSDKNENEDRRNTSSYSRNVEFETTSVGRNKSPLRNERSASQSVGRSSAGQQAVDRAMARARAAAAVIAASVTEGSEPVVRSSSSARSTNTYEPTRRNESSSYQRYESRRNESTKALTSDSGGDRSQRYEPPRTSTSSRREEQRYDTLASSRRHETSNGGPRNETSYMSETSIEHSNDRYSSASILREELKKKRESQRIAASSSLMNRQQTSPPSKQRFSTSSYSTRNADMPPPPPDDMSMYSDLSSTMYDATSFHHTPGEMSVSSIRGGGDASRRGDKSYRNERNHQNILDKLLNESSITQDSVDIVALSRERRQLARLERQAERQARNVATTSQDSYSVTSTGRRQKAIMS